MKWSCFVVSRSPSKFVPLLSLPEKEPPSKHFSWARLEYARHLSWPERHESIPPLLHASEKKTNGELDFLDDRVCGRYLGRGRENGNLDSMPVISHKTMGKKVGAIAPNEGAVSTSGYCISNKDRVPSRVRVFLNARPWSATSSRVTFPAWYRQRLRGNTRRKWRTFRLSFLSRYKCKIRAYAIKYLIPNLELKDGPLVDHIHSEVLNALFNLCKINKRRQEQAAENGIIPHLMNFIMSDSPLKPHALPLLCDMAHASRNSREQLRAHGGLDVYLSLLDDMVWSVTALDSIAVCLAHDNDNHKVEQALLKKNAVQRLVKFFQCCPEQQFVHILEPFLKIITKSSRINTTLAVNGLTPLLIARLDHQDAIARLNLLKLIKVKFATPYCPVLTSTSALRNYKL
ncbi:hypothetical protein OIU84_027333 [Salix udensis]|uniref:ARM repeat superfamily protein n=1 Tax=Salix udensis TaxID=889485 RepID=A0AAD6PAJ0_9ROSI|nr:hypothetical protein OIU84_027333 [Salix udensis]